MHDRVRSNHDELNQIARLFGQEAEASASTLTALRQRRDVLQGGDWVGQAARKFYEEMDGSVLPALTRLQRALNLAQQVTLRISVRLRQAEADAAAVLKDREAFGGETTPAAPERTVDSAEDGIVPGWLKDLLKGAVAGDFADNGLVGILGQTVVGFIPIVGQIADARDIIANIKNIVDGKDGAWIGMGISVLAIIPGLDVLKAGKALKPILNVVDSKVAREFVERVIRNSDEVGPMIGKILEHSDVIPRLAANPEAAAFVLRHGTDEIVESLAKHGDDAFRVIGDFGDDARHILNDYDRYYRLGEDAAHLGVPPTPKTLREAGVGLALEGRGAVPGPITRDPSGAAEFFDSTGQAWDIKAFNSNFPPRKGGFDLTRDFGRVQKEIGKGENVILDTQSLTVDHARQLREAIDGAGLSDKVLWYP